MFPINQYEIAQFTATLEPTFSTSTSLQLWLQLGHSPNYIGHIWLLRHCPKKSCMCLSNSNVNLKRHTLFVSYNLQRPYSPRPVSHNACIYHYCHTREKKKMFLTFKFYSKQPYTRTESSQETSKLLQ